MTSKKTYQVIARKYRPQILAEVIGQEPITTTLRNALISKRVAHAYLFCGCRGTGKTTLARIFSKALNCENQQENGEPCNKCPSCLDITAGNAIDVCEIDGASHRGIDDIRKINETVHYAPATRYKIYIIDEVHMLTKEAFNALLKTLEEPPSHVKFIFATTEPHKVIPTILSRCQRFDLRRIPEEKIAFKLSQIAQDLAMPCEEKVFSLLASLSQGSMRDAESLFDQILSCGEPPFTLEKITETLGLLSQSIFVSLDEAFHKQDLSFAFDLASDLFTAGKDLAYFLEQLLDHYRSHLKTKMAKGSSPYTEEECLYILDFLIKSQQMSLRIPFKRVHLEMTLLHILRSKHKISLPMLIQRLESLEKKGGELAAPLEKEERDSSKASKRLEPLYQGTSVEKAAPSLGTETAKMEDSSSLPEEKETLPFARPSRAIEPPSPAPSLAKPDPSTAMEKKEQCHYDTLLRFSAVELDGIVKPYNKG